MFHVRASRQMGELAFWFIKSLLSPKATTGDLTGFIKVLGDCRRLTVSPALEMPPN